MEEQPKKEIIFTGRLTKERFEQIAKERGLILLDESKVLDEPEDTIFKGFLTIQKLKELCYEHLELKCESDPYSPHKNPNVISLIKQEDGNWKGFMRKNGQVIETREVGPEYALQQLLVS